MQTFIILLFFILLSVSTSQYNVKLGFLFPNCSGSDIKTETRMGFCTSASAALIALDRVKREQLLPNAKIGMVWRFDQCDEGVATGMAIDLLKKERVDVLFGPPCTLASDIVAVIARMNNKPMISWAAPNVIENDLEPFNTRVRLTGSGQRLAAALKDLLKYFDWTKIAVFYSHDDPNSKCNSIIQSSRKQFQSAGISVALIHESDNEDPSDADIEVFQDSFRTMTRMILCNDDVEVDKRFLHEAQSKNLVGNEFVYIIPRYVQEVEYLADWNGDEKTGKWKDVLRSLMVVHMTVGAAEPLKAFRNEVTRRMSEWPFFYQSLEHQVIQGSLYSPFLHDSVYLYALALNKTLESGGSKLDGIVVAKNTAKMQFQGMSGYVSIDEKSVRRPSYVVKVYDSGENTKPVLVIATYKENPISLLVTEDKLWATRSGYRPRWYPKCGTPGGICRNSENQVVNWIVTCAAVLCVFIVCACARCCAVARSRAKLKHDAMMKWKISLFEMETITDAAGYGSKITVNTEVSNVSSALARNDDRIALLRGQLCYIKKHRVTAIPETKEQHSLLRSMMDLKCENLNQFVGLCLDEGMVISVWKYCSKGSLQEILLNTAIKLDWYFKYSFMRDLMNGMDYLHNDTPFRTHGYLKPSNCLISERWILKITDFGLPNLRTYNDLGQPSSRIYTAPELLRTEFPPLCGTQQGDVYSFALVLYEIVTRQIAFSTYGKAPEEVLFLVRTSVQPPFRPEVPNGKEHDVDNRIINLMIDCWAEDPFVRPNFKSIKLALKQMQICRDISLLDHAIKMVEKYANSLESLIKDRTQQLADEAKKADIILYKLLPKPIANRLKAGHAVQPESYDDVTVIFSDIAEFEMITAKSTPFQLISLLNDIYYELDEIIEDYEAYKIQTVNDIYMLATGLRLDKEFVPVPLEVKNMVQKEKEAIGTNHVAIAANLVLHFQMAMGNYVISHLPKHHFQLRIAMHTGSVAAGVVGKATPRYCLFGDTVNVANKLLGHSKPSCIHVSDSTHESLHQNGTSEFVMKPRGEIDIKDLGTMTTFWLLGRKSQFITDATEVATSTDGSFNPSENGSIPPSAKVRAWMD